jgi:hypothetical protein
MNAHIFQLLAIKLDCPRPMPVPIYKLLARLLLTLMTNGDTLVSIFILEKGCVPR